ncbi:hypothetical protein PV327_000617 [Microctonus hyperodae]|nr:hypothetical protein PV327_000617 [Microctonus hyperodae]
MSQKRNNSTIAQDKEEAQKENEMRRQLKELGMYDDGMPAEKMKEYLDIINESKNDAANTSFNFTTNSESHGEVANSSPSSSTVDTQTAQTTSLSKNDNKSTSSEALTGNINKQFQSKDNGLMDEGTLNTPKTSSVNHNVADPVGAKKNIESNLKCSPSASPNCTRNANVRRNENSQEKKTNFRSQRQSKSLDNINIVDCKTLSNDVPLTPRFVAKPRSTFPFIDKVVRVPDEVLAKNNAYLTEIANLAHSWKTQLTCNEFSWGPPIKVGTANRSLDKLTNKEEIPTDSETPTRPITRESGATCYSLRSTNKTKNIYEYDDSDEDIFDRNIQKIKPNILSNRSIDLLKQSQLKIQSSEISEEINNKSECKLVHGDDDEETIDSPSSQKKARSATPEYPEESYPRRIVPPIPSTKKSKKKLPVSSTRLKKRNATSDNSGNKSTKAPSGLNESEIEESLMTNDEDKDIENCIAPPTKRVNQSIEYLKRARKEMEEKKQKDVEETKRLAAQEAQEKKERIIKRTKEKEENSLQLAAQEKSKKEREDRYRNLMNTTRPQGSITRNYQKRIELESEGLRPRTIQYTPDETAETHETISSQNSADIDMFSDNEYETANSVQAVESSECPICRKSFPLTEIENHAANCDDFVQDNPKQNNHINLNASTSNNALQTSKHRCEVCEFVTQNSDIFKKHFATCIQSLTDEGSESAQVASSNHSSDDSVSLNPDSNLRKRRKEQPSSTTNKKKHSGPSSRKRKR